MADAPIHQYAVSLAWDGSTGVGYEHYDRAHRVTGAPAVALDLSSDPAFRGDPSRWNPEQLLVGAAASCQMLSFLAVASRARLDVVAYRDDATAVMPEDDRPVRITRIDLHPAVALADTDRPRATDERLRDLTDLAHRQCFIASSLLTEVTVAPTFTWTESA